MKIKEAKQELIRLSDNDKERERFEKRFESLKEKEFKKLKIKSPPS